MSTINNNRKYSIKGTKNTNAVVASLLLEEVGNGSSSSGRLGWCSTLLSRSNLRGLGHFIEFRKCRLKSQRARTHVLSSKHAAAAAAFFFFALD